MTDDTCMRCGCVLEPAFEPHEYPVGVRLARFECVICDADRPEQSGLAGDRPEINPPAPATTA